MQFESEKIVDAIEVAYRSCSEGEWVDGVLRATLALAGSTSGGFFRFGTAYRNGVFHVEATTELVAIGPGPAARDPRLVARSPAAEASFGKTNGGTISQISGLGPTLVDLPVTREMWHAPIVDVLGLISRDASGDGVAFVAGLKRIETLTAGQVRLLTRVATHVGAADRLPAKRSVDAADAVLAPNGKLLHAAEPARISEVRDGVARRAFARKSRHDAEQALDAWQGLVDGTWSIVDHFDTDGKRFVLAMKNAPEVAPRAELAPQDRRVAALAAMGHRDKEIAYALGITMGTVAAALRRARKAFGVSTRAELAVRWRRETRP